MSKITERMAPHNQERVLRQAAQILEERAKYERTFLESPETVKELFQTRLQCEEREVFMVAFLDNRHSLIECEPLFYGTVDSASVYPREVVKRALELNSAALILCHNHPSGVAEPSRADIDITHKLTKACGLVGIRILDHIIVGSGYQVSLAERGEMR